MTDERSRAGRRDKPTIHPFTQRLLDENGWAEELDETSDQAEPGGSTPVPVSIALLLLFLLTLLLLYSAYKHDSPPRAYNITVKTRYSASPNFVLGLR